MRKTIPATFARLQRGAAMVYMTLSLIPLIGVGSLAVDFGRVLVIKTQLQGATDAAARAAAAILVGGGTSSAASTAAISAAAANTVDGSSLTLQAGDISIGNWANNTFTPGGSPSNAAQVTGYRTAARSTSVRLYWLALLGRSSFDLTATSLVMEVPSNPDYGIVAISGVNINNAFTADGYNSSSGTYAQTRGSPNYATLANGGSWNFSNSASIDGDLYYSGSPPAGGVVTGSRSALPASPTLSSLYPLIATPGGTVAGGNYNGGNLSLTAGNYSYTSFTLNSSDTLSITGTVRIYVSGNINLNGTVNNNGIPGNLEIYNTVAAGVNMGSSSVVFAKIYAPSSPITINGSAHIYGQMIGSTFNSGGGALVHVDNALLSGSGSGKITAVR